jgi:hypothetical protein
VIRFKELLLIFTGLWLGLLFACGDSPGNSETILKEESAIIENYHGKIQKLIIALNEAELNNQLQKQLDLKRDFDEMVSLANGELKDCLYRHKNVPEIPFTQNGSPFRFNVREIKIGGCSFNSEILDFQVQLIAFATAKENTSGTLIGDLYDFKGKLLKSIEFKMTDDFPEPGKPVLLVAHAEGGKMLRSISKIKFSNRGI